MSLNNKVKKPVSRIKKRSSFYFFSPKINLLLLFIVMIGTFVTVAALQQRQNVRQNAASTPKENTGSKGDERSPRDTNPPSIPINVVQPGDSSIPSPVCGGSGQGSVCPSQTQNQPWQPNPTQPRQTEPNPENNQEQPYPSQPGQIEPGQPEENNNRGGGNGRNNNGGGNEGLLNRIIEMLNQIFELIRQLLGGGGGTPIPNNPENPQPSAEPSTNPENPGNPNNPQPTTNTPSTNPGDPNNPQPTVAPSTTVPSTAPSATTGDTTPPSTPSNLTATATSESQINLTWSASTDNSGTIREYEVYRSQGDARNGGNTGINFQRKVGTATRYSDTNLQAGVTYYYYVRAFDPSNNRSEHSNTAGATTKAKIPAKNTLKVTVGLSGQTSLKDKRITIQVDGPGGYSKSSTQGNTVNKTDSYSFTSLANGKYSVHVSYGTWNSQTVSVTFDSATGNETISKTVTLKK